MRTFKNKILAQKKFSCAFIACVALMLFDCGSESGTETTTSIVSEVETFSELGKCSDELEGTSVYVKQESVDFICTNKVWINENYVSLSLSEESHVFSSASLRSSSSFFLTYSSSLISSSLIMTPSSSSEEKSSSSFLVKSSSSSQEKLSSKGISSSSSKMKDSWLYLNPDISYGEFKDNRDGQIYKKVKIGKQTWMAENLNYDYNTGLSKSVCYQNSIDSCSKYGKLYNWEAAKAACPKGWHLPTIEEWRNLITIAGGPTAAKIKLRSVSGWSMLMENGSDDFGFSVLPAGNSSDYAFVDANVVAWFWSAGEYECNNGEYCAYSLAIYGSSDVYERFGNIAKPWLTSIRCVEGSAPPIVSSSSSVQSSSSWNNQHPSWNYLNPDINYGKFMDDRDGQIYKTIQIGDQVWMAENLNFNYNESSTAASYCYNNSADSCAKYGRLYTWVAAMKACPDEWHLPTEKEWKILLTNEDESCGNWKCFMSGGGQNQEGTDVYGFSIIRAGEQFRNQFRGVGQKARFWLGTENYPNHAKYVETTSVGNYDQYKNNAYSVRCLKGAKQESNPREPIQLDYMTDSRDGQIYPIVTIGTQTWMAKNLNYENRDKDKEHFYWKSANSSCPAGWHLPSYTEWNTLIEYVEGDGAKLKDIASWDSYCFKGSDCSGTDDYMFSIQPTEYNWGSNKAVFWTSTMVDANTVYFSSVHERVGFIKMSLKNNVTGMCASVRCIKDAD